MARRGQEMTPVIVARPVEWIAVCERGCYDGSLLFVMFTAMRRGSW